MLEEIYNRDDELTEDDYYDALLFLLGDTYPNLSDDELEDMLEDMLDRLPDRHAESVLDTIGNVGKSMASGALKVAGSDYGKAALMAGGTMVGGPVGAKVVGEFTKYIPPSTNSNILPETGKALALMQNPQAQTAIARASLGIGNGTAPLSLNGATTQVPVAFFLRAMLTCVQSALMELEKNQVVPPPAYSQTLPYAEDIDQQAEWLVECLTAG